MTSWLRTVLILVAILVALAAVTALRVNSFLSAPANIPAKGVAFEIAPGTAFRAISEQLAEAGIISHPEWFRWYARLTGDASTIHAGEFLLGDGDTPRAILKKFVAGEVELYSFTIVEGWNFSELMAALQDSDIIEASLTVEDWPAVLESLAAEYEHPEGLFLPETYRFPKGTKDVDLLRQAYSLMQKTLAEEWADRERGLPITSPYETLILASIIEKETARADERPTIAGVFVRRLQQKMRLQTDPTVIYGLGDDYDGNITRQHLTTDTPYNTYTRHGLPPTPIALPGRAAINAALHPAPGNELFFVATGLGDGSHNFSETKEQHDAAVKEYLARRRANRNK